jgi:hypothetical protein
MDQGPYILRDASRDNGHLVERRCLVEEAIGESHAFHDGIPRQRDSDIPLPTPCFDDTILVSVLHPASLLWKFLRPSVC